jgi:hypothetical protein
MNPREVSISTAISHAFLIALVYFGVTFVVCATFFYSSIGHHILMLFMYPMGIGQALDSMGMQGQSRAFLWFGWIIQGILLLSLFFLRSKRVRSFVIIALSAFFLSSTAGWFYFKQQYKKAERAGAANPCAFGTSGTSAAEQPLVPEASRDT